MDSVTVALTFNDNVDYQTIVSNPFNTLTSINRKQILNKYKSNFGNKYVELNPPVIPYVSVYRLSNVCPAIEILIKIKQYLQLPIDLAEIVKISSYRYLLFPSNNFILLNDNGTINKSVGSTIFDPIPLHKISTNHLQDYKNIIQKLLLFRYLLGLNMSQTNLYCTFKSDNEIDQIYSHKESKPFGLDGKHITNIVDFKEKKTMQFGATILKKWFYPYQPGQILQQWLGLDKNSNLVLTNFYHFLQQLVMDKPCYKILPDLIIRRIDEAMLPK